MVRRGADQFSSRAWWSHQGTTSRLRCDFLQVLQLFPVDLIVRDGSRRLDAERNQQDHRIETAEQAVTEDPTGQLLASAA